MNRREFIVAGTSAVVLPSGARAQKQFTIGYLGSVSKDDAQDWFAAFRERLREDGFIVGENITIEYRSTQGQLSLFSGYASDLVQRWVDLIYAVLTSRFHSHCSPTPTR